jgi:hypothetical protein
MHNLKKMVSEGGCHTSLFTLPHAHHHRHPQENQCYDVAVVRHPEKR